MNALIDTLNVWAEQALRFAWPMLWQSSLLIGLLFALDLLMRRKVRPAVRYALWLVVLIKLLLPPSLAFPTSPGWWLRQAKAAATAPRATTVVVTSSAADSPVLPAAAAPVLIAPPRPRLTPTGWGFVGMLTVSVGLLGWMLLRWQQVAHDARQATAAPTRLSELLPERRRPVRLRLTDHPQSPAVCGLFRPVILLPRSLAEHLPPTQLRAVLLHELLHLRRGDVWVNCAQALLQIVYWWHPLLWFANARIRRVREEAVDDAVMLALNDDAEAYAPTLLEVAKLALHRPLASLGLVGILESRSSLRQRIERLMDFRPPRKAGLTLTSALAVLGFAALAVPMGEAPAPAESPQSPASQTVTNTATTNAPSSASPLDQTNVRTNLIRTSDKRRTILHQLDTIRMDQVSFDALPLSEVVRRLNDETRKCDPEKLGVNFTIRPAEPVKARSEASLDPLTGIAKPATPAEPLDPSSIAITIKPPLTNVRLADVLDAVVKVASRPIKYSIQPDAVVFSAKTGKEPQPLFVRTFKVDLNTVLDRLHLTKVPVPVGTNGVGTIVSAAFLDYFKRGGVDLDAKRNPGKALFYNASSSMLVVRAYLHDIDIIEQMIVVLIAAQPQINIKCKFVEIPQDDTKSLGFDWNLGNILMTNGASGGQAGTAPTTIAPNSTNQLWTSGSRISSTSFFTPTGILTDPQFRVVIKALQQRSGTELLAQPEVTTISGRQAQMKAVNIGTLVMGLITESFS